jgi:hypothetical protein
LEAAIEQCTLFLCDLRKNRALGGNRFAPRFPKQTAMAACSPPSEKRAQKQYGTHQECQ